MLFEFQKSPSTKLSVDNVRLAPTDVLFEIRSWVVAVDAPISRDRTALLEASANQLVASLDRGAAAIDRPMYESFFGGHFAALAFNRDNGDVYVLRDVVGAKTIFISERPDGVVIGTNTHEVMSCAPTRGLSKNSIRTLMVLDHFLDGETFYADIREMPMGSLHRIAPEGSLESVLRFDLDLAVVENTFDFSTNVAHLREKIIQAHADRAGAENIVLLSGGIDSSVMLCALRETVEASRLRAMTFRVKGTRQDETEYAKQMADELGVSIELVEIDPNDERLFADFDTEILKMNNPYFGRFIFGNFQGTPDQVYFAGQDTRLHTPDLNGVDRLAFALFGLQQYSIPSAVSKGLAHILSSLTKPQGTYSSASRSRRGMYRAAMTLDTDRYLPRFFFNLDLQQLSEQGLTDATIQKVSGEVELDWRAATNQRQLYNMIVAKKWGSQYTDDMRYLQDLGHLNNTHVALPFYDISLARFSSTLPMKQAASFMSGRANFGTQRSVINKIMLRQAFKEQLPEALYLRAKAVSNSQYLLFAGVIGRIVRGILQEDAARGAKSIALALGLEPLVARFHALTTYRPEDEVFLTRIYWLATIIRIGGKHHLF